MAAAGSLISTSRNLLHHLNIIVCKNRLVQPARLFCNTSIKCRSHQLSSASGGAQQIPEHCNVLIVGGGIIGSFVAYWLQRASGKSLRTCVLERDTAYTQSSTVLSVGGIRQQFSLPENIQMSLFALDFIQNASKHLFLEGDAYDDIDVGYKENGYLLLAGKHQIEVLQNNYQTQCTYGAKLDLLSKSDLIHRFPFLNTEDVEMASYGRGHEGWVDPWLLLSHVRRKAMSLGGQYVQGHATGLTITDHSKHVCQIETCNKEKKEIRFDKVVICSGSWSGQLCSAITRNGKQCEKFTLPIEKRKRFVYYIHAPDLQDSTLPLVNDNLGVYIRPEGPQGHYICGSSPPSEDKEPDTSNLDVDYDFFYDHVWPKLAHRIPALENLKVLSAWAGYYDYNTFDQNVVVGGHPTIPHVYIASGASGHGLQQGAALGRAVTELLLDGKYSTIDLRRFSCDRLLQGTPIYETNII